MRLAVLALTLGITASAFARCDAPVLVYWSYPSDHDRKELSEWWEHAGQKRYPQLCLTEKLDEATYVLVLARSSYNTTTTITVPHQQREHFDATISTWYGDADLSGYVTVTQYQLRQQQVQCDVVSAFLYVRNAPYPSAYAWRVYTSGSHAFLAGLGAGLMAAGGSNPPLTACDLGSRKPVKDSVNAVLRFAVANPVQHNPQATKVTAATEFRGTYTGGWQSSKFNAAGTALMVMNISEGNVRAEVNLTGGMVTKAVLYGKAVETSDGWEVSLRTANGDLVAGGSFRNGAFEGDYNYSPAGDLGRWVLKKD